jgi:ketosteroid isomerase-like protein
MRIFLLSLLFPVALMAQSTYIYEPSSLHPYGSLNPEAPKEVADFAPMIGVCDCLSSARKADRTWGEPQKMTWTFKYIMNGMAVQDETLKEDGSHSGSIRQFIADSSKWYVHWYSNTTPSTILPTWEGNKRGDSIVLYRDQKAPNGMDGKFRLTFKNISENGFNWIGEWVDLTESVVFPTWKIDCVKRRVAPSEEVVIRENINAFSRAYAKGDHLAIADMYTENGHIFPNNSMIISGREAIAARWKFSENVIPVRHKITPSEIKIIGNYAYDFGYFEGATKNKEGMETPFKGKYVIIWRKENNDWKIFLDIWNSI